MWLRTYPKLLTQALTTPSSYVHILNERGIYSFSFFFISYIWLGILTFGLFFGRLLPELHNFAKVATQESIDTFPTDWVISWNGSSLATTPEEMIIPFPAEYKERFDAPLLHIDTKNKTTETGALFNLTTDTLVFSDEFFNSLSLPLAELFSDLPAFNLTKDTAPQTAELLRNYAQDSLRTVILVGAILFPVGLIFFRIVGIIIDSLFIYLLGKLWGLELGWKQWLQIGMYVGVVAETVSVVGSILYTHQPYPLFGITFWVLHLVLFYQFKDIKRIPVRVSQKDQA